MDSMAAIRALATVLGIVIGSLLGIWTAGEQYLVGPDSIGVSAAWYGFAQIVLTYLTVASGTISGVLHITDYAGRIAGEKALHREQELAQEVLAKEVVTSKK